MQRKKLKHFLIAANKIGRNGLITSSSGNLSTRIDKNSFMISASGRSISNINRKEISICYLDNPAAFEGPKPSIETDMHRQIYARRNDINAILHFQSLYATVLSCSETYIFADFFPEGVVYLKNIIRIPYHLPGSPQLAKAIADRAEEADIFILSGHGQVAAGKDTEDVIRKALFLEFACKILYLAKNDICRYSAKQIQELLHHYG